MSVLETLSAALASLKTIAGLAREANNAEMRQQVIKLQSLILKLQEDLMRLQTENTELREQNRALQQTSDIKQGLEYAESVYWRTAPDSKRDGPFCPNCCDIDNKLVRLKPGANPGIFLCPTHDSFHTAEYRNSYNVLSSGNAVWKQARGY